MKTRRCLNRTCGKTFRGSTARMDYGRGRLLYTSRFCSTECRELHIKGRREFERLAAVRGAEQYARVAERFAEILEETGHAHTSSCCIAAARGIADTIRRGGA